MQSKGGTGTHWPGVVRGECITKHCCHVIQGSGAVVLIYGSKMWNLTKVMLMWLEGFHICAAYGMAQGHKPCKGLLGKWEYPLTNDVLEECGLCSVKDYIDTLRSTIAMYVVTHPIFRECKEREQR